MTWLREHDFEVFLAALYVVLKVLAWFTTPDDHFLYATFHGHSDDVLGALIVVIGIKYFNERLSDE